MSPAGTPAPMTVSLPAPASLAPAPRERRELVLVLGMHRSGTSALAGLLARLGVELGHALMPASRDNSAGYFENEQAVGAHEALLLALDREWHDPRPLPQDWLATEPAGVARERLAGLLSVLLAEGPVVSVKDPRACRLVPLWREVAAQAGVRPAAVLSLRHPDEVAASLARRDGMSVARAHLLWMVYLLESERDTRGIDRAFVEYGSLLQDWRTQVARMDEALGLGFAERVPAAAPSIDAFLDTSMRHHAAGRSAPESPFRALALQLYALAQRCATDSAALSGEFDAIAHELAAQAATYLAAIEDAVALELPLRLREERQRTGLDRARIDAALQLAALRELWRPSTVARGPGPCKLYYGEGQADFVEAHALSVQPVPAPEGGLSVRFELPAGTCIDRLRIDPDDAPGVFAILELQIDGEPVDDFASRIEVAHEIGLPISARPALLRLASVGHDPHFTLDVRGLVDGDSEQAVTVEMRFEAETVASEITRPTQELLAGARDAFDAIGTAQQVLVSEVERLNREGARREQAVLTAMLAHAQASQRALADQSETLLGAAAVHARSLDLRIETLQQAQLSAAMAHAQALDAHIEALQQAQAQAMLVHAQAQQQAIERHSEVVLAAALAHAQTLGERIAVLEQAQSSMMLAHAQALQQSLDRHSEAMLAAALAHTQTVLERVDARTGAVGDRLAAIEERQAGLAQWTRRRSLRYWWGRLLGRDV